MKTTIKTLKKFSKKSINLRFNNFTKCTHIMMTKNHISAKIKINNYIRGPRFIRQMKTSVIAEITFPLLISKTFKKYWF